MNNIISKEGKGEEINSEIKAKSRNKKEATNLQKKSKTENNQEATNLQRVNKEENEQEKREKYIIINESNKENEEEKNSLLNQFQIGKKQETNNLTNKSVSKEENEINISKNDLNLENNEKKNNLIKVVRNDQKDIININIIPEQSLLEEKNEKNNIPKPKNKNSFYIRKNNEPNLEFQLKGKKVKQNIDLQEFIHSIAKLKAHNSNKFALGLESGAVKIYTFDEKSGDISNFLDFKEHQTALTYVLGLSNGNLLTCSTDKTIKIIGLPKSFFKTYIISQVFQCAPDSFYFQTAIEMTDGNIIAGDWKNIVILQPQKK